MTTILDLPVHPLAVHAPIILVALLVLFGLLYLFVPPLRQRVGWVVAVLLFAAPASAYGSIWSGEQLANYLSGGNAWSEAIEQHQDYGWWLLWTLVALIPVWGLFAGLDRGRRTALKRGGDAPKPSEDGDTVAVASDDPAAAGRKVVMFVVGIIALALLLLAAFLIFQSGHSGADMKWGGTVQ
ncbi:hypothetical protein [Glycomyces paridis]|uniref:Uncharacterized protein n=1 Tax=Glycomyces paridis TaxID=2126555 RepID=A0A4S8PML9_9ACTN|nr:hypothetical protein [Glycomyces paridis]THV32017.1 hypothetical protein E9998_00750 [Glycomyces paridis]